MSTDSIGTPIRHAPGDPVTAIALDGNSVIAAAVSLAEDGGLVVHYLRTIELDDVIMQVERYAHPIFMDVDYLFFPDTGLLGDALREIAGDPRFQNPVVGVFPAHCVAEWSTTANAKPHAAMQPDIEGLQSANPYAYPRVFGIDRDSSPGGESASVWSARLDDILALGAELRRARLPFLGLVTGRRAAAEAIRLLATPESEEPFTLIDVGKLRTLYAGFSGRRVRFSHVIPVGLIRDDIHYFTSTPPVVTRLMHLEQELGGLFSSPNQTPSPSSESDTSSPQEDCTRFALQVARYTSRVLHDVWPGTPESQSMRFVLAGRPSRLPGFREFLEQKVGVRIETLDENPPAGIRLGPGSDWRDLADHLPALGAAVAFHRRDLSRSGLILRDRRPQRLRGNRLDPDILDPSDLYLIERATARRKAYAHVAALDSGEERLPENASRDEEPHRGR